ncbi:MAG: methionyl-tRNA formyltransferase [Candidatus Omnitrophica bacterium]|nr:methionyl-tRNA formyltransferase [Candidatus Omnitrophota bacterium]
MNIIFFGSGKFAVPSLKALVASGYNISCVVTQPDRRKGRGLHMEATAAKAAAAEYGLKLYQPERINTPQAIKFLEQFKAQVFVVISYGQILSEEVLKLPEIFAINAHASLLPKYRGASPINWAMIKGEKITGVSIIKMDVKMDAGAVILHDSLPIEEEDTSLSLEERLSLVAARLVVESLALVANNKYKLTPQDQRQMSLAPKLKKENGLIDWKMDAEEINNLVRGSLAWPGAFTYYKGKLLKVFKSRVTRLASHQITSDAVGRIINIAPEAIRVSCGKDFLDILELQMEGKRRMPAAEFIAGHKIRVGEAFEKKSCTKKLI